MSLDQLLMYFGSGLVLYAVELLQSERNLSEVSESMIDARIEEMDHDEIIHGVATGVRLMKEEPDPEVFAEDAYEPEDMFDEIDRFLREQDES